MGGSITFAFLMPADEHVNEIPLTTNSTHMTNEDPQGENDAVYPLPRSLQDVHFATIEEKKRLWFRDALINSLFIASWFVPGSCADMPPL
jgi:solute carrier family 35 protein C2